MKAHTALSIRKAEKNQGPQVLEILTKTGFFRPDEIQVAKEVFYDAVANKPDCTYLSYTALLNEKIAGWICLGPAPCTLGTFDIYWIAVDPDLQKKRIGTQLMNFAFEKILAQKGRLAVIETSGSQRYIPTQAFYEKTGFSLAARVADFYAPGDDKLIYIHPLLK